MMDEPINEQKDNRTDECTDGRTDKRTTGQRGRRTHRIVKCDGQKTDNPVPKQTYKATNYIGGDSAEALTRNLCWCP